MGSEKTPKANQQDQSFFPFRTSWLLMSHLNLLVGPWLIFYSHLFPRNKRHEFMPEWFQVCFVCASRLLQFKELNLAASPALRRLFGRVIDAVGSAVAGTQDVSARIPSIEVDGLKQAKALVISVTSTVDKRGNTYHWIKPLNQDMNKMVPALTELGLRHVTWNDHRPAETMTGIV